jgi:tight adherence protein C
MVIFGSVLVIAAFLTLFWAVSAPGPANLAEDNLREGVIPDARQARLERTAGDRIITPIFDFLAAQAQKLTSTAVTERLARQLQLAGLASRFTVEQVLAFRLALMIIGIALAAVRLTADTSTTGIAIAVLIVLVAYLIPRATLARRADERQHSIRIAVPDVLDQITVSVEAGLGFDSALARAATNGRGPFAEELSRVLQDIQVGRSRDQALDSLLKRTEVDDLRKFVFAIRQAERYGLPIANVLRVQAKDARERRRSDAEERAAQLPVKLVFPLVLCILPALFVVVLGPAAITIFDSF